MLSRRFFVACGLCAATGFAATPVGAEDAPAAPAGIKRTILQQTDGPAPGYVTLAVAVEIAPGFTVPRHTHPGIESSYILEGAATLVVDGQPDRPLKPGEAFQVPAGVPHAAINGSGLTKLIAHYIVEKGKPLASPA